MCVLTPSHVPTPPRPHVPTPPRPHAPSPPRPHAPTPPRPRCARRRVLQARRGRGLVRPPGPGRARQVRVGDKATLGCTTSDASRLLGPMYSYISVPVYIYIHTLCPDAPSTHIPTSTLTDPREAPWRHSGASAWAWWATWTPAPAHTPPTPNRPPRANATAAVVVRDTTALWAGCCRRSVSPPRPPSPNRRPSSCGPLPPRATPPRGTLSATSGMPQRHSPAPAPRCELPPTGPPARPPGHPPAPHLPACVDAILMRAYLSPAYFGSTFFEEYISLPLNIYPYPSHHLRRTAPGPVTI